MAEPRTSAPRGWWIAIAATLGVVALAGAVIAWWIPKFLRQQVIDQAAARGVLLDFQDYDLEIASYDERRFNLSLHGVRAEFAKIPNTTATIESLDVAGQALSWSMVDIKAVELDGVSLKTRGQPEKIIDQLLQWSKETQLSAPAQIKKLAVAWEVDAAPNSPPTLVTLSDAELLFVPETGADLTIPEMRAMGQVLKQTTIASKAKHTSLSTLLEAGPAGSIPIELRVETSDGKPQWQLQTEVADLSKLAQHMGLANVAKKIDLDGVGLRLSANAAKQAAMWQGRAELSLTGYTPPHPIELSGFDFGKTTKVAVKYRSRSWLEQIQLSKVGVQAGVFRLSGSGHLVRQPLGADLHLDLSGHLPCNEVAASAARARDNSVFGRFFSKVARQVLNGSVGVRILVDTDVPLMLSSRVQRGIGLGCGLRPLREIELKPILDAVPELGEGLPTLSETLDKLPKPGLPAPPPRGPLKLPSLKDLPNLLPNIEIDVQRSKDVESGNEPASPP